MGTQSPTPAPLREDGTSASDAAYVHASIGLFNPTRISPHHSDAIHTLRLQMSVVCRARASGMTPPPLHPLSNARHSRACHDAPQLTTASTSSSEGTLRRAVHAAEKHYDRQRQAAAPAPVFPSHQFRTPSAAHAATEPNAPRATHGRV